MNNRAALIAVAIIIVLIIGAFILNVRGIRQKPAPRPTPTVKEETAPTELPTETPAEKMEKKEGTAMEKKEDKMTKEEVRTFTLDATNFKFSVNEIKVKKGEKVKIVLNIKEGMHDWVLDELNAKTKRGNSGETVETEFTADKTGSFEYYCSVGNHRAMGMVGKLIVE